VYILLQQQTHKKNNSNTYKYTQSFVLSTYLPVVAVVLVEKN